MLEIGIPLLGGFAVGIGVGYYVREQVLHKERIERRLESGNFAREAVRLPVLPQSTELAMPPARNVNA